MYLNGPRCDLSAAPEESVIQMQEKGLPRPKHAPESPKRDVSPPSASYPSGWRLAAILISLIFGTLLVALDNTIIGVAVPMITTEFKALNDVGWYASAYLITVTALQPTYGNIYKYFPIKRTYLIAILVFEGGSVLCAASPNSLAFIIGRAISGVGAAGVLQGSLGVISLIAPLKKRPLYFSIVLSIFGVAVCAGPILGGFITDHVTWRWCFWMSDSSQASLPLI
jgi:MFS family permease